jgi:PhnB protein
MNIPKGHQAIIPYLIVKNAAKLIEFTKNVFDAKETFRMNGDDEKTIRHAEVNISGSAIMLADSIDQWPPMPAGLFVYVDDADTTYKKALDNNATSIQEPSDKEYGRSCGVKDEFGNTWWITSA